LETQLVVERYGCHSVAAADYGNHLAIPLFGAGGNERFQEFLGHTEAAMGGIYID
jgi:hypothetical protein